MKKFFCVLAILLLFLSAAGCSEERPQEIPVYTEPVFTPGVLQSDVLAVEEYNFDRMNNTANGDYLESESGYYVYWWGNLFYAEKSNPDAWYYVCSDPSCQHRAYTCSANSDGNTVWYADGKIYFNDTLSLYPQYSKNGERLEGMGLFSMAQNGNDIKLEAYYEDFTYAGSAIQTQVIPGGYLFGGDTLLPDGSYEHIVYLYEHGNGETILYRETEEERALDIQTVSGLHKLRICGDFSAFSVMFTKDWNYKNTICWLRNGEPAFSDVSQIPVWGGYLHENTIRCFYPGDGYYDVDLLTGEKTKLADAQLTESKAMILQPNCIIETTLLNPEADVEVQEMRFFDGVQWHTVALPEELLNSPDDTFEVVALASDCVIFSVKRYGSITDYYGEDSAVILYRMELGEKDYQVTYMGTFAKPAA